MTDLFTLAGRKALVTGANTGIGQAIAVTLAGQGAHVICAGRRSCDETVAAIETAGGRAQTLLLDFADPMAAQNTFKGADVSILVNNAGIIRRADSTEYSEADWDAVIDVNQKALFFTCQAFGKELIAKGQAGSSLTSRPCCRSKAASACQPIPRPNTLWRASPRSLPTNGRLTTSR